MKASPAVPPHLKYEDRLSRFTTRAASLGCSLMSSLS
jgi:hypothetical protein